MTYDQMIKQMERMTLRFQELEQQGIFEEPKITKRAQYIIEESIELIEQNRFNELFDKCFSDVQVEVAEALLAAGFDLEHHLDPVPPALYSILNKTSSDNYNDVDEFVDGLSKRLSSQLHIPTYILKDTTVSLKKWKSESWTKHNKWLEEIDSYA